jgi:uncharacterized protein YciI
MSTNEQPQIYYVFFHTPGPAWVDGIDFREQPGVIDHVKYMASFLATDQLLIGGPFLDNSGGMMVMRAENQEAAERAAYADPAVKAGLLRVNVKPWLVPMATVR